MTGGNCAPIGVFDSGYGGLTVLRDIISLMPQYDMVYLGDNARTPYGSRSFDVVCQYTREAVQCLLDMGCPLVILACNTASAKALRDIQQKYLPKNAPDRRVLGVIRPSVEYAAEVTRNGHVGVLATVGTVTSSSYPIELRKWSGGRVLATVQQACPMWVPLVENNEINTSGAAFFVHRDVARLFDKDPDIDTLILGCTHYPLLIDAIRSSIPTPDVRIIEQGKIVAQKLADYLRRHPEIEQKCTKNGKHTYFTTEEPALFRANASLFMGQPVESVTRLLRLP